MVGGSAAAELVVRRRRASRVADVSVEVPSPLRDCFLHCETECVRECCGIDAIATDPESISAWRREAGPPRVAEARRQLDELVSVVEDRTHNVSSSFLNHYTCDDSARRQLLDFLAAFRAGLAPDAEPGAAADGPRL
jgi:hypothetical protein